MKIKLYAFVTVISLVYLQSVHSQTYEGLEYMKVKEGTKLKKKIKAKGYKVEVDSGFIVKTAYELKNGNKTYTISKTDTFRKKTKIPIDKTFEVTIDDLAGKANLYFDKENKIGFVNFWLGPVQKFNDSQTVIKIIRSIKDDASKNLTSEDYIEEYDTLKFKKDTIIRTFPHLKMIVSDKPGVSESSRTEKFILLGNQQSPHTDKTTRPEKQWYDHTLVRYEVIEPDKKITRYYGNKYDRDVVYELDLKNREYLSLVSSGIQYGPLTIPIKLRGALKKDSVTVDPQAQTDLNLGLFVGKRIGNYRVRYEHNGFKQLPSLGATVGVFGGISTAQLDKNTTSIGKNPITGEDVYSLGVFSTGLAAMLNIYNVKVGVFFGWDFAFGNRAQNWNYNGKYWTGIGLAYDLQGFWKK